MEEKRSKQPLLFLFVALTASVCLAVTIAYLEIRRDAEVEQLRNEVSMLIQYVEMLKLKINRTETFTKKIDDMLKKPPKTSSVGGSYDDDDDYYDENYDYDYDDIKSPSNNNNNSTSREKRSVDDNGARIHNILHMRTHPMFQHAPDNPQVMAKIVIAGEDESHTQKPNFAFHQAKPAVRHGKKHNRNKPIREDVEDINGCSHAPVLAHFGGDTSAVTRERHYSDNHRMYHPDNIFREWSPAAWVSDLQMDTQLEIDRGIITVTDSPGIYYFYAQIFYADVHDSSGYKVLVNNHAVLQCTTTTLGNNSDSHHIKRNSCYTGGLIKLESGDRISLRELEGQRYTVFERTKSFFGLFKVASTTSS